jgi:peptide/nickel transport system substrate-binding protein
VIKQFAPGRRLVVVAGILAGVLALSACSAAEPDSETSSGAEGGPSITDVTIPLAAGITTLDTIVDVAASTVVIGNIFEALTFAGGNEGVIEPWLAESWETEDNITWTFHLAEDATWHDGTPLTADDVVFTYETERQPENGHSSTLANLSEISAIDEHTVQMVLKAPNAAWTVTIGIIYIAPKAVYEAVGPAEFAKAPIGSGPYEFSSLTSDGGVELTAWPDYRGGVAPWDSLNFVPVTSAQAQLAGLQSGDLDVVTGIPYNQIGQIEGQDGLEIVSGPSTNTVYAGYNVTNPALADKDVRDAIDMAIDRQALIDGPFQGYATALGSMVPEGTFGSDPDMEPTEYDPEAAEKLLAKSDYDGSTITLTYPTANMPMADEMGRAIGAYLGEIGLEVELQPLDYATFISQWVAKEIPGMYLFQYRDGVDSEFAITSLFAQGSRAYFDDDEIQALVAAERSEVDPDARAELIHELWAAAITEKRYYSPLIAPDAVYGAAEGLDFPFNPSGLLSFNY